MKKIWIVLCFLILSNAGFSQITSPPQTTQLSTPARSADFDVNQGQMNSRKFESAPVFTQTIPPKLQPLYRSLTASEYAKLKVDESIKAKYRSSWFQENSGIFTLLSDLNCADNTRILTTTANCSKLNFPGAGTSYSFRKNVYRLDRLADLSLKDDQLFVQGKYALGIIANLGDVDFDKVSLKSPGVKEIRGFVPEIEPKLIEKQSENFGIGVMINNIFFSNKLKVSENSTFVLRNIAYRTKSYNTVPDFGTYNEFEFDKRADILVVFRVVKKNEDGSLVILWKKLAEKKSPKVKFST